MQTALLWAASGTGFTFLMTTLGAASVFLFRKRNSMAIQRGLRMLHHHRRITPELFAKYRRRYSPHGSVASLYLWEIAGGAVAGLRDWAPKGGEAKRPRPDGAKGGPRGD